MDRRNFLLASSASAAAWALPGLSWAAPAKTSFRWVPQADLTLLDPMFTTVAMTQVHAQLVFDTLYGLDEQYQPSPQMAAGHVSENDGLLWKITLRDDLAFHDGAPVRADDGRQHPALGQEGPDGPFADAGDRIADRDGRQDHPVPAQEALSADPARAGPAVGQHGLHHARAPGRSCRRPRPSRKWSAAALHLRLRQMGLRLARGVREVRRLRAAQGREEARVHGRPQAGALGRSALAHHSGPRDRDRGPAGQ